MPEFTVASWNILLDKHYPQADRIDSLTDTINNLEAQRPISALGLLEVENKDGVHHGQYIANTQYGNGGVWAAHSRKTLGEAIGIAGTDLTGAEVIDLGHKKKAVLAYLGDVAIVAVHLRRQPKHIPPTPEQVEQMSVLLERLGNEEKAIIMGDFNCIRLQKPRRMLGAAGFVSAFPSLNPLIPRTVPMSGFKDILGTKRRLGTKLTGGGINVDDIYVKNLEVVDSGLVTGASDHALLWATLNDPKI